MSPYTLADSDRIVTSKLVTELKPLIFVLALVGAGAGLTGCGGAVNVQASGGGADGFASLGVLMLGTSAIRYIRDQTYKPVYTDDEPLPPPARIEPDRADDAGQVNAGENTDTVNQ